jgi:hypothetical protein
MKIVFENILSQSVCRYSSAYNLLLPAVPRRALPRRSSVSALFPREGASSPPHQRHSRADRVTEIRSDGDKGLGGRFCRRICVDEGENASRDYGQNSATAEACRPVLPKNHSGGQQFFHRHVTLNPASPSLLSVCHDFSCHGSIRISLNSGNWRGTYRKVES